MQNMFAVILAFFLTASAAFAADWKTLADEAVLLSPGAAAFLENKKEKTEQDVYQLTLIYYRDYHHPKLKKLYADHEKTLSGRPALKLLQGVILLREHRYAESRAVLEGLIRERPDIHAATFVLGHLHYLRKDFERSYALARQLIRKKKDISRYHYVVSLLLAAGAKGMIVAHNLLWAIPAYFEVNGYFREARQLMPEAPEVLYGIGSYHLLTPPVAGGDIDLALSLLEKSRRLTPLNTSVYVRLAQGFRAKKDETAYANNIARARELDPQDELLLDYLSGEKVFLDVP